MRFTTAWSSVLSQNVTLRSATISLSVCLGLVSVLAVKLGAKEPIVIERSCYSKLLAKGSSQHTKEEIEAFLRTALSQRFDSGVEPSLEVISLEEVSFKKQEQQDLTSKNMRQKVIINSVDMSGADAKIDADRLIAVGQVRTALAFPIRATISTTNRSDSNPYGLILNRVSQISKKDENQ